MSSSSSSKSRRRPGTDETPLMCRVKYRNTLPEIPFPPKFLPYPFQPTRFTKYGLTSLEEQHKHVILAPPGVGVTVDLLDKDAYKAEDDAPLHPKDEALCRPVDLRKPESREEELDLGRLSWLRKTEYISTENRAMGKQSLMLENKILATETDAIQSASHYKDRQSQIELIEKTFSKSLTKPRHPTDPNLEPVEILPVLPDFQLWRHNYYQGVFDDDPAPHKRNVPEEEHEEQLAQALLKGEENYTNYFLPDQATLRRRKRRRMGIEEEHEDDNEPLVFDKVREYTFKIQDKEVGVEDSFFFVVRPGDACFYNELPKKLRLTKRRKQHSGKSKVTLKVNHRDWSEQELAVQDTRLKILKGVEEDYASDMETEEKSEEKPQEDTGEQPSEEVKPAMDSDSDF